MTNSNDQIINLPVPGNFQFSAVKIEDLGATEYTLVTIVCDISGSVEPFSGELLQAIKTIIVACQKSPRYDNLLIRLLLFNREIIEVHGFKALADVNANDYVDLQPEGMTALYDASFDGICSTLEYSKRLIDQDFDCNGAVYIITDGCNNQSTMTPESIKKRMREALQNEEIESLITVLIGIQDPSSRWGAEVKVALENFKEDAGISEFINAGDATPQKLAKIANWVSESISSQSQALQTGGPSQILGF